MAEHVSNTQKSLFNNNVCFLKYINENKTLQYKSFQKELTK